LPLSRMLRSRDSDLAGTTCHLAGSNPGYRHLFCLEASSLTGSPSRTSATLACSGSQLEVTRRSSEAGKREIVAVILTERIVACDWTWTEEEPYF
jgi:hypothetical protein